MYFEVTNDRGAQYTNKAGQVIFAGAGDIIKDADISKMYVETKKRKVLRYGFKEIREEQAEKAESVDAKIAEAKQYKKEAAKNKAYKEKA